MIMGHAAKKHCEITEISFFEHKKKVEISKKLLKFQ